MTYFTRLVDFISLQLARFAAICAIIMMLAQVSSVILRYIFSYGVIWLQELVTYGHSIIFLLGAAYVLQKNAHVRVDIFYDGLAPALKKGVDLASLTLFIAPVSILICIYSWPYVENSWSTLESSRQAGGLPAVFLLKTCIIIFAASMALQAMAVLAKMITGAPDSDWNGQKDMEAGDA